jgi:hypothetical protein
MPYNLRVELLLLFAIFFVYAFFSSPHQRITFARKKFTAYAFKGKKLINEFHEHPQPVFRFLYIFFVIRELYLISLRFSFIEKIGKIRRGKDYPKIYSAIIKKRFKKDTTYLIAGDHFSSFYPRNLGFFYSKALDPKTSIDLEDYKNRIVVYLNSLEFALSFYKNISLTTTITPLFRKFFTRANIFSKPSDTLCSLLLALDYLIYPDQNDFKSDSKNYQAIQKQGQKSAKELLKNTTQNLREKTLKHIKYLNSRLGVVDTKHSLSGIRDGLVRQSSFYENVVMWKTIVLALKLDLITEDDLPKYAKPEILKQNIIKLFVKNKLIYNDLTEESEVLENYSADFLVAYSLQFFDLQNKTDLKILTEQVDLMISNPELVSILGPFYSLKNPKKLVLPVKLFAPDYMGRTIWSHWSTEFVCLLSDLYLITKKEIYKNKAETINNHLMRKVVAYKGYPELYDANLKIYKTTFYTSMIDTGWIVNFEFARLKVKSLG